MERLESLIHSVKHILQGLAVYVGKVRPNLFALYQSGRLFGKANALARHEIGISAVLQAGVVQLTAQVKVMLQQPSLPGGGVEAILI